MSGINKIFLSGWVSLPPNFKTTPKGVFSVNFSLSVGNKERPMYIKVRATELCAQRVQDEVSKGDMLFIEGCLNNYSFPGEDGKKVNVTEVVMWDFKRIGLTRDVEQEIKQSSISKGATHDNGDDNDLPF